MKFNKKIAVTLLLLSTLLCVLVACDPIDVDNHVDSGTVSSNITFVDETTFKIIQDAYDKIDFSGEFKKENIDLDNYYKEQFYKLLKCNKPFLDKQTQKEYYTNEFGEMKYEYNPNNYIYYFFDMDGDSTPELSISDGTRFIYIMKYYPDTDKIILWHEIDTTWIKLMGSGKLWFYGGSSPIIEYAFWELDENGEEKCTVRFYIEVHPDADKKEHSETYMVAMPKCNDDFELSENMKKQGVKKKSTGDYYFRITKDQWEELTGEFFSSRDLSEDKIKDVSFTFKELFDQMQNNLDCSSQ